MTAAIPKPCLKAALTLLRRRTRKGLTPREYMEIAGYDRLAGRVCEIRRIHGEDAVETVYERNANGGRHARYFWRAA